jgi:hypothetical protein
MRQNHASEVAHLLNQIETEYIAAQRGLIGIAQSARHTAITARMEHMGLLHKDLQAIVGDDAIRLIAERLNALSD